MVLRTHQRNKLAVPVNFRASSPARNGREDGQHLRTSQVFTQVTSKQANLAWIATRWLLREGERPQPNTHVPFALDFVSVGVEIQIWMASLILAQDKRWRRA